MKPPETDLAVKNKLKLKELCARCGQPLPEKNKGTITGWIFDNEYKALTEKWVCRCGKSEDSVAAQQTHLVASPQTNQPNQSHPEFKIPPESEFKRPSHSDLEMLSQADLARSNQSDLSMEKPVGASNRRSKALPAMPPFEMIEDRWRLIEPIGTGQLGATYKAISVEEAREVVVKILNTEIAANPRMAKRFLQECKKAAALHRKNVAAIYDYGRLPDGRPYVVSEYCPTTLASTLEKEGFLDVDEALKLADELCDGLTVAHQAEIIHRGLKPENVMFLNDTAKLADVGVAKALPGAGREAMDLTATSYVFGDPVYTSPEQCQGYRVDERSDIYSLGGVLYHALTGKRPFGSKKGIQLALAQLGEAPRSFDRVMFNCDIPEDVERLVMKCLEKDPLLRYQSIAALQKDIRTLRSGKRLKGSLTKASIPFVVPLKIRHHARSIILIALAAMLTVPAIMMLMAVFSSLTSSLSHVSYQPNNLSKPGLFDPWVRERMRSTHEYQPPYNDPARTRLDPSLFAVSRRPIKPSRYDLNDIQTLEKIVNEQRITASGAAGRLKLEGYLDELASLYEKTGKWQSALTTLDELKRRRYHAGSTPSVALIHLRAANIARQMNDLRRSESEAKSAAAYTDDEIVRAKSNLLLGELTLSQSYYSQAQEYFEKVYNTAPQDSWEQTQASGYLAYIAARTTGLQLAEHKFGTTAALLSRLHTDDSHLFSAKVKYAWGDTVAQSKLRPRSEARSILQQAKNDLILAGATMSDHVAHPLYLKIDAELNALKNESYSSNASSYKLGAGQDPRRDPYALQNDDF